MVKEQKTSWTSEEVEEWVNEHKYHACTCKSHEEHNIECYKIVKNKRWLPADKAILISEHEEMLDQREFYRKRSKELEFQLQELKSKSILIEDVEKAIEDSDTCVNCVREIKCVQVYDLKQKLSSLKGK
ncbi:MAG: hypothetical protein AABY22_22985 [Nanoarchaeota archaeon]